MAEADAIDMGTTMVYSPNHHNVKENINEFSLGLLNLEPRIMVYQLGTTLIEDQHYIPTKEKIYIPFMLPNIPHELAHILEMKDLSRIVKVDFDFVVPKNSHYKKASSFFAALSREIRVRAIQLHISYPDSSWTEYGKAAIFNILDHVHWGREAKSYLPFGRFKTFNDLQDWCNDLRDKTYFAWSEERVRHEWNIRLDYIRNWMETS